jgi:hypothetical protein
VGVVAGVSSYFSAQFLPTVWRRTLRTSDAHLVPAVISDLKSYVLYRNVHRLMSRSCLSLLALSEHIIDSCVICSSHGVEYEDYCFLRCEPLFPRPCAVMIEAADTSEMPVTLCQIIKHHISGDNLQVFIRSWCLPAWG